MIQVKEYINRNRGGENLKVWIPVTHIYYIRRNFECCRKLMIFLL
jgi:hypothetical protein